VYLSGLFSLHTRARRATRRPLSFSSLSRFSTLTYGVGMAGDVPPLHGRETRPSPSYASVAEEHTCCSCLDLKDAAFSPAANLFVSADRINHGIPRTVTETRCPFFLSPLILM